MTHVRRLRPSDRAAWLRFASDIPSGEERFFKEDITDQSTFDQWIEQPARLVAVAETEITGIAVALPGTGWSAHVAELRVIVRGSCRGRGLGRTLSYHGLVSALKMGCSHVYVEVVAEQTALVSMFKGLGFRPEALLADFVRDAVGTSHDLMILTHNAEDNWSALAGLGLAEYGG